ncbi:hypothetical protein FAGKG844_140068 [Frankia sp. AgKG'84/4]
MTEVDVAATDLRLVLPQIEVVGPGRVLGTGLVHRLLRPAQGLNAGAGLPGRGEGSGPAHVQHRGDPPGHVADAGHSSLGEVDGLPRPGEVDALQGHVLQDVRPEHAVAAGVRGVQGGDPVPLSRRVEAGVERHPAGEAGKFRRHQVQVTADLLGVGATNQQIRHHPEFGVDEPAHTLATEPLVHHPQARDVVLDAIDDLVVDLAAGEGRGQMRRFEPQPLGGEVGHPDPRDGQESAPVGQRVLDDVHERGDAADRRPGVFGAHGVPGRQPGRPRMGLEPVVGHAQFGRQRELGNAVGNNTPVLPTPYFLAFCGHVRHTEITGTAGNHPGEALIGPTTLRADECERMCAGVRVIRQHRRSPRVGSAGPIP